MDFAVQFEITTNEIFPVFYAKHMYIYEFEISATNIGSYECDSNFLFNLIFKKSQRKKPSEIPDLIWSSERPLVFQKKPIMF